jgi:hypothetical protein
VATGLFRGDGYRCNETAYATEWGCTSSLCGADTRKRDQYQYCTGTSATCGTSNLKWDAWQTVADCTAGQLCQYDAGAAWCAACAFGCSGGACNPDPCQGVTCNTPPDDVCLNGTTLRDYNATGTCSGGSCSYGYNDVTCSYGCTSQAGPDVCAGDPCQGVTCNTPPANYCVDASYLRQYQSPGTCSNGNCDYSFTNTFCQYGCNGGACNAAQCTSGACCDTATGQFRLSTYQCNASPYATEYGCTGTTCGSDARRRYQYQYCTGSSSTCGTGNLQWAAWAVIEDCSASALCQSDSGNAWCTTCQYGCSGSACNAAQCTSGDCCDTATGQYRPSSYQCDANPYFTEYGCTGSICGSDAQLRHQYKYCTGSSATCGTTNLVWGSWQVTDNCATNQLCQSNASSAWCQTCQYGCSGSACVTPQCTSGTCCDTATGLYRPSSYQCNSTPYATEYRCYVAGQCGADGQRRYQYQNCTGSSDTCGTGNLVWAGWTTIADCSTSQICTATPSSASCTTCALGCTNGACNTCPGSIWASNGHCYWYVSTGTTWDNAEAACVAQGGHLVSINSSAESDFARSVAAGDFWIGLRDYATASSATGNCDDCTQNCVASAQRYTFDTCTGYDDQYFTCGGSGWFDFLFKFTPPATQYYAFSSPTSGRFLALTNYINNHSGYMTCYGGTDYACGNPLIYSLTGGTPILIHIDGTTSCGSTVMDVRRFVFTDGVAHTWHSWNSGEPNNSGNNEDCTQLYDATGYWNDLPCNSSLPYVCERL